MTADLNFTVICSSEVYVIAHVPIGYLPYATNTTAVRESYNEQLVKIFRNYSDVVEGQFYGHTHRDSIMVLLDQQGNRICLRTRAAKRLITTNRIQNKRLFTLSFLCILCMYKYTHVYITKIHTHVYIKKIFVCMFILVYYI